MAPTANTATLNTKIFRFTVKSLIVTLRDNNVIVTHEYYLVILPIALLIASAMAFNIDWMLFIAPVVVFLLIYGTFVRELTRLVPQNRS